MIAMHATISIFEAGLVCDAVKDKMGLEAFIQAFYIAIIIFPILSSSVNSIFILGNCLNPRKATQHIKDLERKRALIHQSKKQRQRKNKQQIQLNLVRLKIYNYFVGSLYQSVMYFFNYIAKNDGDQSEIDYSSYNKEKIYNLIMIMAIATCFNILNVYLLVKGINRGGENIYLEWCLILININFFRFKAVSMNIDSEKILAHLIVNNGKTRGSA